MTELLIDGIQVVLPKDFSIQVKRENPLITKNGEYTYEITLQLTNPTNAKLYKHLNRLNNVQEVETKRSAVLIADNRVYCNGTEIITGWTDDTVSIQIASGNSELNYFIGSDLLISFLEMKKTSPGFDGEGQDSPDRLKYVQKTYPEVEYCLAPVKNGDTDMMDNEWLVNIDRKAGTETLEPSLDTTFKAQPYLCAYLRELLRAMGYELTVNQLEETVYKDLYICHTEDTIEWSKMLPSWSVRDFLEQVELLFNAVFVVDNRKRQAKQLMKDSFFTGEKSVHVQQVEDVYELEMEEPETDDAADSNVSYQYPDTEYWRWRCLSEAVKKAAKKEDIPTSWMPEESDRIYEWFKIEEHRKTDTIYTDKVTGRKYLFRNMGNEGLIRPVYAMVDEFEQLERDGATTTIELEIMPVSLDEVEIPVKHSDYPNDLLKYQTMLPSVSRSAAPKTDGPCVLEEMIVNGSGSESSSKGNIYLAFFTGIRNIVWHDHVAGMPFSFPQPYTDEYIANPGIWSDYYKTNSVGASLRLPAMDSILYQSGYDTDYTKAVKIHSHDPNVYATNSVFEIRNRLFVCKEIEYTIDAWGRKGAWTGTFYPFRISSDELQWILADGRWRDGGVWLDDGKWLDG